MASYPSSTRLAPSRSTNPVAYKFGRGVKSPIRRTPTGGVALSEGEEYVREGLRDLCLTVPLEGVRAFDVRNGVPYGTSLRIYQFESITQIRSLADFEMRRAFAIWETRAVLESVDIQAPDGTSETGLRRVKISGTYRLRSSGVLGSMTFELLMKAR